MASKKQPKQFVPLPEEVVSGIEEAESIDAPDVVLTVNGNPIPPAFAHAITYAMTDQGIAEARAKDAANPVKPTGVRITGDAWDKKLQRKEEAQVWDNFDPLSEAVDGVREPGMTYRFLSDRLFKRRGRRGWESVTDKDGKLVQVAGMTLGKMSEDRADRRNAHYQEIGNEQLRNAAEQYTEDQARLVRDARVTGLAPLRAGETVTDNSSHPGMVTPVGVHTQRGGDSA